MQLTHYSYDDGDTQNNQITVYDLYNTMRDKQQRHHECYQIALNRCYARIRKCASVNRYECMYEVPGVIVGMPLFDTVRCVKHVVRNLHMNGFRVVHAPPATLHISWDVGRWSDDKPRTMPTSPMQLTAPPSQQQRPLSLSQYPHYPQRHESQGAIAPTPSPSYYQHTHNHSGNQVSQSSQSSQFSLPSQSGVPPRFAPHLSTPPLQLPAEFLAPPAMTTYERAPQTTYERAGGHSAQPPPLPSYAALAELARQPRQPLHTLHTPLALPAPPSSSSPSSAGARGPGKPSRFRPITEFKPSGKLVLKI